MSQEQMFINGELLRIRREARGWALNDLATRACMSVKQIRQLEEGGMSSFYSAAVKMTSAKKVGALLGMSAAEVLAQEVEALPEPRAVESQALVVATTVADKEDNSTDVTSASQEAVQFEVQMHTTTAPVSGAEEHNSKTSLWVIAGLFAAALAVAAYMQPKDEPAVEAPPPLQVLPADAADPASVASAADVQASSAEVVVLPPSPINAAASAPRVAVPVARAATSVIAGRPASAIVTTPAASATNKAP